MMKKVPTSIQALKVLLGDDILLEEEFVLEKIRIIFIY